MAWKNWDIFIVECSEEKRDCKVCNEEMQVERNILYTARGGSKIPRDRFTCKHSDEQWHKQVLALRMEIKDTPSKGLAALMEIDVKDVLAARKATKKFSKFI